MGTYDANEFLNVGDVSPSQTFTINVQGCPTAKSTVYSSGVSANVRLLVMQMPLIAHYCVSPPVQIVRLDWE